VHDFLTVGAPAPLQEGVAAGLEQLQREYYDGLLADYAVRRKVMCQGLRDAGFRCTPPAGSYYVLADFSDLSSLNDIEFSESLTRNIGVAVVPGSSFYSSPELGRKLVRFAFCKTVDLLEEAVQRLLSLRDS
jgi:aminotransferase